MSWLVRRLWCSLAGHQSVRLVITGARADDALGYRPTEWLTRCDRCGDTLRSGHAK